MFPFRTHQLSVLRILLCLVGAALLPENGATNIEVNSRRQMQQSYYCVAKSNADATQLQEALDWACGSGAKQGNVDCSALQKGGSCSSPDSIVNHASYAFDVYFSKQGGLSQACDFDGLATLTTTNPSSGSCVYPSASLSSSSSSSSSVPSSTTATNSPTTTTSNTSTSAPLITTVPPAAASSGNIAHSLSSSALLVAMFSFLLLNATDL